LSLGVLNSLPGFDFDSSVFIQQTGISSTATIPLYGQNNLPSSNNFADTTTWSSALISVTPNALSNPFGTATDASLISNINIAYGNILRFSNASPFLTNGTRYMMSIYAKAGVSNFIGFRLGDIASNSGNNYSFVNLSTGVATLLTPTNGTNHSLTATLVGNGWYRVEYSFTNATSANYLADFALCDNTGSVVMNSTAGTRSVYVWGAQIEVTTNTSASAYAETGSNILLVNEAQLRTAGTLLTQTINPRSQIDAFVRGVKDLGLWNNILFWPLRSYQNANSGLIAYSLGGLGTFNGSLSGMTTSLWRNSGLNLDGVNDQILTSFTGAGSSVFCGYAGTCQQSGSASHKGNMFGALNSNNQAIYWTNPRTGFGAEFRYSASNTNVDDNKLGGHHFWATRGVSGSATRAYIDGSLVATAGTASSTPSPLSQSSGFTIGRYPGGFAGSLAFAVVTTADVSSPSSFYNLYKTTLGVGLGLP
jgi:hypothetical protein